MRRALLAALSLAALARRGRLLGAARSRTRRPTPATPGCDLYLPAQPRRPDRRRPSCSRRSTCRSNYLVSPSGATRTVDLDGRRSTAPATTRVGLLRSRTPSDLSVTIEASALDGKWYAASFPGGQWAAPDRRGRHHRGRVLRRTRRPSTCSASPRRSESPATARRSSSTALRWPSTASRSRRARRGRRRAPCTGGMLHGLPYAGTDTYEVADDAIGELILPDYMFTQAHRVRAHRDASSPSAGETSVTRQVSFLFECFGEVARATERDRARPNDEFHHRGRAAPLQRTRRGERHDALGHVEEGLRRVGERDGEATSSRC